MRIAVGTRHQDVQRRELRLILARQLRRVVGERALLRGDALQIGIQPGVLGIDDAAGLRERRDVVVQLRGDAGGRIEQRRDRRRVGRQRGGQCRAVDHQGAVGRIVFQRDADRRQRGAGAARADRAAHHRGQRVLDRQQRRVAQQRALRRGRRVIRRERGHRRDDGVVQAHEGLDRAAFRRRIRRDVQRLRRSDGRCRQIQRDARNGARHRVACAGRGDAVDRELRVLREGASRPGAARIWRSNTPLTAPRTV